jgi:hypothetical protein
MPTPGPNASNADKIKWILEGYEDPSKYTTEETNTDTLQQDIAKVNIKDDELSLEEQIRQDFCYPTVPEGLLKKIPSQENNTQDKQDASPSS